MLSAEYEFPDDVFADSVVRVSGPDIRSAKCLSGPLSLRPLVPKQVFRAWLEEARHCTPQRSTWCKPFFEIAHGAARRACRSVDSACAGYRHERCPVL